MTIIDKKIGNYVHGVTVPVDEMLRDLATALNHLGNQVIQIGIAYVRFDPLLYFRQHTRPLIGRTVHLIRPYKLRQPIKPNQSINNFLHRLHSLLREYPNRPPLLMIELILILVRTLIKDWQETTGILTKFVYLF